MAVQIVTKNSNTASSIPDPATLVQGELAINVKDRKLFSKDADGNVFELSGSGTGGTGTLQQVTDAGNTTTNDIETGKITAPGATFDGPVSIGGTAAANKIDEYEEGTWTPDVTTNNGDPRTGVAVSNAAYRRIGGIVTCSLRLILDADESTGSFKFSLPFGGGAYGCCSLVQTASMNGDTLSGYISGAAMRCGFPPDHTSGTKDYRGSFTYKIN